MQIILTDHARERLSERIGARPHKHQRIAEKAWRSSEPVDMREVANAVAHMEESALKNKRCEWRKLMGFLFCFTVATKASHGSDPGEAVLCTVAKPANGLGRRRVAVNNGARNLPDQPRKTVDQLTHPKSRP